jgi:hypothetical protein
MYSEHRRMNPKVVEVRQFAGPGGAVTVVYENGDLDNGDLDGLIDNATEVLSQLIALRLNQPTLPACAGSEDYPYEERHGIKVAK